MQPPVCANSFPHIGHLGLLYSLGSSIGCCSNIWLIIISIIVGLILQIIDSAINRKYLYDIEIEKEAKRSIDVERRKKELIEEREKLND